MNLLRRSCAAAAAVQLPANCVSPVYSTTKDTTVTKEGLKESNLFVPPWRRLPGQVCAFSGEALSCLSTGDPGYYMPGSPLPFPSHLIGFL